MSFSDEQMIANEDGQVTLGVFIQNLKRVLETFGDAPVTVGLGSSDKGTLIVNVESVSVACSGLDYSLKYVIGIGKYKAQLDGKTITLEDLD
jgi:hypothetical protein